MMAFRLPAVPGPAGAASCSWSSSRGSISSGHPAYGVDVGWVIQKGANELARTGHLYGVFWPLAPREFAASGEPSGLTYLLDGTIVNDFGYPPLGAMLSAVTTAASGLAATAAVWPVIGLLCAAVILFVRLPNPLRPLSVIVCFGLPRLTGSGVLGIPVLDRAAADDDGRRVVAFGRCRWSPVAA
jgi:hypothetical protein